VRPTTNDGYSGRINGDHAVRVNCPLEYQELFPGANVIKKDFFFAIEAAAN